MKREEKHPDSQRHSESVDAEEPAEEAFHANPRNRSATLATTQSGVEAPALMPTRRQPWNHSRLCSSSVSTCQVLGWISRQMSARWRVLALFFPPTTTTASTSAASERASVWRSSV